MRHLLLLAALLAACWPARAFATLYGAPYAIEADDDETGARLLGTLQAQVAVTPDGALILAARAEAERVAAAPSPALPDLRALLAGYGVTDYLVRGAMKDAPDEAALIRELVPYFEQGARQGFTRVGIGTARDAKGRVWGVGFALRRLVAFTPFPSTQEVRPVWHLDGRLLAPLRTLELSLTDPAGRITRERVLVVPSGGFVLDLPLARPGAYQAELLGDEGQGPRVVASFRLQAGAGAALAPTAIAVRGVRTPEDVREVVRRFTNDARRRAGLAPLALAKRLTALENTAAERILRDGDLVHRDTSGEGPEERLKAAHVEALAYGENLGRHRDPASLLENLMQSPAHRANILNPRFTELGIGVARDEAKGEWIVGQLFLLPDAPRELAVRATPWEIPLDFYARLHERRYQAQSPPVAISRRFSLAAEKALVQGVRGGTLDLRDVRETLAAHMMSNANWSVRSVIGLYAASEAELAEFPGFVSPLWRVIGLAALPVREGGYAVLMLFGDGPVIE